MKNKGFRFAVIAVAGCLIAAVPGFAASDSQAGDGQAVITVLPEKNIAPAPINAQDLSVKVNGKASKITSLAPLQGPNNKVELVMLIDDDARSSLGNQMNDIANFLKSLPPNTAATVGYMQNGRTVLAGPFTKDHDQIAKGLHLPLSVPQVNASPYLSLSELAKNWPSHDTDARREVVMVTDGVDYYDPHYDPYDPYVQSAVNDAVKAHIIVYSIYWLNTGRYDRTFAGNNDGQNLLLMVTGATGGNSYWIGTGNPVSLIPFLDDVKQRLNNQYELGFMAPPDARPGVATFKVKVDNKTKIDAPQQVLVNGNPAGSER